MFDIPFFAPYKVARSCHVADEAPEVLRQGSQPDARCLLDTRHGRLPAGGMHFIIYGGGPE